MLMFFGVHAPFEYRTYLLDGRKQSKRIRPVLETPPWFHHLLTSTGERGVQIASGPGLRGSALSTRLSSLQTMERSFQELGLLRCEPHQHIGTVFADLNRQEQLWHNFLQQPFDAYSLRITHTKLLARTVKMCTDHDGRPISLRRACFKPGIELFQEAFVANES